MSSVPSPGDSYALASRYETPSPSGNPSRDDAGRPRPVGSAAAAGAAGYAGDLVLLPAVFAAAAGDLSARPGLFQGDTLVVAVYDASGSAADSLPSRIVESFLDAYPDATVLVSTDFDELTPGALNVRLDVTSESHTPVSVTYTMANRGLPGVSYGPAEANIGFSVTVVDLRPGKDRAESSGELRCERAAANNWTESERDVHARAWRACIQDLAGLVDPYGATATKAPAASTLPEAPPASAARFTGLVYRAIDRTPPTDPAVVTADVRAVWACVRAGMDTGAIQAAAERGVAIVGKDASMEAILAAGRGAP
jgi:hypothetical protein